MIYIITITLQMTKKELNKQFTCLTVAKQNYLNIVKNLNKHKIKHEIILHKRYRL